MADEPAPVDTGAAKEATAAATTATKETMAPAPAAKTATTIAGAAAEPPEPAKTEATASGRPATLLSAKDTGAKPDALPSTREGAPEKYGDFAMPSGMAQFEGDRLQAVHDLFREAGLSQDAAQRFVDFHGKEIQAVTNRHTEAWNTVNKEWRDAIKGDKDIGSGTDSIVKPEVSAGLARLIDRHLGGDAFRSAMEVTGAGNHPDVVRGLYKISQLLTEGTHIEGAPARQEGPRRSIAQRMYPSLVPKES